MCWKRWDKKAIQALPSLQSTIDVYKRQPIDSQRFYEGMDKAISKIDNTELRFYLKDSNKGVVTVRSKDIIFEMCIRDRDNACRKKSEQMRSYPWLQVR